MVAVSRSTEEKQSDAWLECSATQPVTATMLKNVNTFFAAVWMLMKSDDINLESS